MPEQLVPVRVPVLNPSRAMQRHNVEPFPDIPPSDRERNYSRAREFDPRNPPWGSRS